MQAADFMALEELLLGMEVVCVHSTVDEEGFEGIEDLQGLHGIITSVPYGQSGSSELLVGVDFEGGIVSDINVPVLWLKMPNTMSIDYGTSNWRY